MFDVGFFELCLVGLVALLVFGPERLPEVARTAGRWIGRLRRFVVTVKQDIDRELRLEELQRSMKLEEQNNLYQFLEKDVTSSETLLPKATVPNSSTKDDPSRPTN